jgi:hypothetical protein
VQTPQNTRGISSRRERVILPTHSLAFLLEINVRADVANKPREIFSMFVCRHSSTCRNVASPRHQRVQLFSLTLAANHAHAQILVHPERRQSIQKVEREK